MLELDLEGKHALAGNLAMIKLCNLEDTLSWIVALLPMLNNLPFFCFSSLGYIFYFKKIFIYLFWLPRVLVAAHGILVEACMWDLVPRAGMEPRPPALGTHSLTHWTTREVPHWVLFVSLISESFPRSPQSS